MLQGVLNFVVFMGVVIGLAALLLAFRDRAVKRQGMSEEQHRAAVERSTGRLTRGWALGMFVIALLALVVNAFNLDESPLWQRVIYFVLAAFYVIGYLSGRRHDSETEDADENGESS